MRRNLWIAVAVLLLAGCQAQSQIQAGYAASQKLCRASATRLYPTNNLSIDPAQRRAALASSFSECMNQAGWNLTKRPNPGSTAAANNPPAGSPSTNPSAATAPTPAPSVAAPAARVPASPPLATPSISGTAGRQF